MNPHQPGTSTTDTILKWLPASGGTALTAAVVLSAHAVLHVPPWTSAVLAVSLLRREAVLAALGALFGVLTAAYSIIYVPVARKDPSAYLTTALAGITSALGFLAVPEVAARTEPRSPGHAERANGGAATPAVEQPAPASLPVLPPATNAARSEDEPEFWQLVHDRLSVSGRRPGVVPPAAKGRHAKMENSGVRTSVTADSERGYEVRVEVRSPEERFARAA